jgi:hypothetical protein
MQYPNQEMHSGNSAVYEVCIGAGVQNEAR